MKKMMFFVSLIVVVLVSSCSNKKQDIPTEEEVVDVNVTFVDPQIKIADNTIIVAVTALYPDGEETIQKRFPILYNTGVGYKCYSETPLVSLEAPKMCCFRHHHECEGEWSYEMAEYNIVLDSHLQNISASNKIRVWLPQNISVTKYGKQFVFDNVFISCSADNDIEKKEEKLYNQKISLRLSFNDYWAKLHVVNEIWLTR